MSETHEALEDIEELFGGKAAKAESINRIEKDLEAIVNADIRNLYQDDDEVEGVRMLSPKKWPDAEARSLVRFTERRDGAYDVVFADPIRAADQLAKIRGLYRNEETVDNPFEQLLARIPRVELVTILKHLRRMGDLAAAGEPEAAPAPDERYPF